MVHDHAAATEQLAGCLQKRGYRTKVIERLRGPLRLQVSNPAAAALTETIIIHEGAYWWSWRDQIGSAADAPAAAEIIARVLAAADETS